MPKAPRTKHGIKVHKPAVRDGPMRPGLRVILATKPGRAKAAPYCYTDMNISTPYAILDATSGTVVVNDRAFSPLTTGMESAWQGCKTLEGIDMAREAAFWEAEKSRTRELGRKCARRSPLVRAFRAKHGKNPAELRYASSELGVSTECKFEARRSIYGPLYRKLVLEAGAAPRLAQWRAFAAEHTRDGRGVTIVVKDVDGPRTPEGQPTWVDFSSDVMEAAITHPTHSCGHGYFLCEALVE